MEKRLSRSSIDRDTALLLLIALGTVIEIEFYGRITAGDLLCIALFPMLFLSRAQLLTRGTIKTVLLLALLWFIAQVVTDQVRSTPFEDWIRGWARIAVFMINLCTITMLTRLRPGRTLLFAIFLAGAGALKLFIGVAVLAQLRQDLGTAWKFGYGYFVSVAAFALSALLARRGGKMSTAKALPFGAAALALAFNARSMFGLTALSAIAQLITRPGRRISTGALLRYVGIVAVGAIVVVSLYSYAAETGRLGAEARAKYFAQSESEIGLLGGRKEFLASSQAIEDSPLIGHGSWAKDVHYIYVMERRMRALGISVHRSPSAEPLIPSHSHILGAWVEAGLAGAVFWSFVLWLTMRAFASVLRHPPPEIGLICFFLSGLAWDLVFSPFGLDRRLTDAALICIVVATLGRQLGGQRRRAASGPAGVRQLGGRARFQPGSAARFPQGPRASQ